jgi:hypothetical protein
LPKNLEIPEDCELVLLNETTEAAGVGSWVVFALATECRPTALSEEGADNDGLEDKDARTEGGVHAGALKVLEARRESAKATDAFRSLLESVGAAE